MFRHSLSHYPPLYPLDNALHSPTTTPPEPSAELIRLLQTETEPRCEAPGFLKALVLVTVLSHFVDLFTDLFIDLLV